MAMQGRGFGTTAFSPGSRAFMKFFAAENWTDTAQGTYISLATTQIGTAPTTTSAPERMRITDAGKVGIGTTTPGSGIGPNTPTNAVTPVLQEVDGSIILTYGSSGALVFQDGSVQTTAYTGVLCGGDYAESVDVTGGRGQYEPGDILVIDPANGESFTRSAKPYSTVVAGIYSTKPGALGRKSTDPAAFTREIPMAMIGIVPTKVSAENGAIKRGDLLVTSATPGYAMKGTDRGQMLGAIVGKALGPLNSGTGVIDVLVTLQ
jgi:hypothetical protein